MRSLIEKRGSYKISDKKGLSPVIASILLIALVLVLAAIIFLWARGFISEQIDKFGKPVEDICEDISFEANLYLEGDSGYTLEIANRGNVPIHSFDIKQTIGGDAIVEKFKFSLDPGEAKRQGLGDLESDFEKITIYPSLLGHVKERKINNAYPCNDKSKIISESQVTF